MPQYANITGKIIGLSRGLAPPQKWEPRFAPVFHSHNKRFVTFAQTLLEDVLEEMKAPATVHWVEGASHGLTLKGRAEESVMDEVNSRVLSWVLQHS